MRLALFAVAPVLIASKVGRISREKVSPMSRWTLYGVQYALIGIDAGCAVRVRGLRFDGLRLLANAPDHLRVQKGASPRRSGVLASRKKAEILRPSFPVFSSISGGGWSIYRPLSI
jgi:hypothetical protein